MAIEATPLMVTEAEGAAGSAALRARPVPMESREILGMRVDGTNYAGAVDQIARWARGEESRYVCVSTVHMVMEGHDDPEYQRIVNGADMVTSDGMPLVWGLRLLGARRSERVYGPDLTPLFCERAAMEGIPVGFYGSSPEVLDAMVGELQEDHPNLKVAYRHSPPFRDLTEEEERKEVEAIRASGARVIFVGLGCPKQERWMHARKGELDAVMVGVGAAFDYIGKTKSQAPEFMQAHGLEWLFRLVTEPRRLWRRYLYHNPRFVGLFALQLARNVVRRGNS